jgi:hypothetical protein
MPQLTIICGGGQRSGSTWQYNAVRAIVRANGLSAYAAWIGSYEASRPEPVHIVKLHDPALATAFPAAKIVGSYRDLRDVVQSLDRMGWLGNGRLARLRRLIDHVSPLNRRFTARRFLDRYIESHRWWTQNAVYMMRYEAMKAAPADEVARLAIALDLPLTGEQAARIADALAKMTTPVRDGTIDPDTLLHAGHIASGPHEDRALVRFIDRRYGAWLAANGYAERPARAIVAPERAAKASVGRATP